MCSVTGMASHWYNVSSHQYNVSSHRYNVSSHWHIVFGHWYNVSSHWYNVSNHWHNVFSHWYNVFSPWYVQSLIQCVQSLRQCVQSLIQCVQSLIQCVQSLIQCVQLLFLPCAFPTLGDYNLKLWAEIKLSFLKLLGCCDDSFGTATQLISTSLWQNMVKKKGFVLPSGGGKGINSILVAGLSLKSGSHKWWLLVLSSVFKKYF